MTTATRKARSESMLAQLMGIFPLVKKGWENFWFRSPAPAQMGLFRSAVGIVILLSTLARTFDLEFFYGNKGMMPQEAINLVANMHWRHSIFEIFPSMTAVWICHIALIATLSLMICGIYPRAMALPHVGAASFFPASERGDRVRRRHDCDLLPFLSLLRGLPTVAGSGSPKLDWRRVTGSMFYRVSQIQVCLIYGFAGLDKVKGSSWWRGDAIWMIFANTQRATIDLSWMAHFPAVMAFMTYGTLFFEVYFPVMVWFRPVGRFIALVGGVLMHCGIAITMGLVSFSSLMISTYSLFLDADVADKITQCVKKTITHRKVFLRSSDENSV